MSRGLALDKSGILALDRQADQRQAELRKEERMPEEKAAEKKPITVYVRRGPTKNHRSLTFARPSDIPTKDLLAGGYAVDGNAICVDIAPHWGQWDHEENQATLLGFSSVDDNDPETMYPSLATALQGEEQGLMQFLGKHGYEVEFD